MSTKTLRVKEDYLTLQKELFDADRRLIEANNSKPKTAYYVSKHAKFLNTTIENIQELWEKQK